MRGFVQGLFLFTLGLLVGASVVDRMSARTSDRTKRMITATDVQRAKDLTARGDLAAAREAWIRANLLHPGSFGAHMGLGAFYACAEEWEGAARQYERAIESYPGAARVDLDAPQPGDLAEAHARLGRAAARFGREVEARREFEQALTLGASLPRTGRPGPETRAAWTAHLDRLDGLCPQRVLPETKGAAARNR